MEKAKSTEKYGRFAAMIATSTVVMYGLMYLNTLQTGPLDIQRDPSLHGAPHGSSHGGRHARVHAEDVRQSSRERGHLRWKQCPILSGALARPKPGDYWRRCVHEGDDSAPFHCNFDE